MANIVQSWKRCMFVGCSHGKHIDRTAENAVLSFRDKWKPVTVWHLGDWWDTTYFRGGAAGTPDQAAPIRPDVERGLSFLAELGAEVAFDGNHENRIWQMTHHYDAGKAELARILLEQISERFKKMRCVRVPYHVKRGWRRIGDYLVGHGYSFGKAYLQHHADKIGNCVIGHGHRAGISRGERLEESTCFGVGTLCRMNNMDYASTRFSTLSWSAGIVYGEYTGRKAQLWLHDNGQSKEWHLPPA